MRTRRTFGLASVLCAVLVSGVACADLPTSGPVVTATAEAERDTDRAADVDARPPGEGATRTEIAAGFLDAMTSWPIETNVAKQFLTRDAAEKWNPEAGTVVYSEYEARARADGAVRIQLEDAVRLDGSGGWRGPVPDDEGTVDLRIVQQEGEYRVANPPDALLVPNAWFQQRFRQVSLYFLDPAAEILVPEPVFVPIGEQLATSLVGALVAGPPERLANVVRTMVPSGVEVGLSVPVNEDGVARIDLVGDTSPIPPAAADFMVAQFAWTLRQDPAIEAFRITVGGEDVTAAEFSQPYDVDSAAQFDPSGEGASDLLYGLQDGLLVSGSPSSLEPVAGPLGQQAFGLESVAVTPMGDRAAGVVADGTRLVRAPVADEGAVRTVLEGSRLARPSWDAAERLWVLDRAPAGARIRVIDQGRVREIDVPGVTGENARMVLVSRDGTRLISVIREGGRDRVVASRVVIDARGRVRRAEGPTVIRPRTGPRVVDVAWSDPGDVSLLTPSRAGSLFEVTTIPVNGGLLGATDFSVILRGLVRGIAGAPQPGEPLYAVRDDDLVDLGNRSTIELGGGTLSLDYAG